MSKVLQQADADANADNVNGISPLRIRLLQHATGNAIIERARAFINEHASTLRSQIQGDALTSLTTGLTKVCSELVCATASEAVNELETRLDKIVRGIDTLLGNLTEEPPHGSLLALPLASWVAQDWGHRPQPLLPIPTPMGSNAPNILI